MLKSAVSPRVPAIRQASAGYTLVEISIAMLIFLILLSMAMPAYNTIVANNRAASFANEFVAALRFARSESSKRRNFVTVCAANTSLTGCGNTWQQGWVIFLDVGNDGNYHDGTDTILRVRTDLPVGSNISPAAATAITYESDGFLGRGNGDYVLMPTGCAGDVGARTVTISNTGRTSISTTSCGS